jgi:phosphopantothenoylcysteine decarboxylase/phosphopantothenate--cysteine ligase
MTRGAEHFVGAASFEGVTGRRVHSDIFESGEALAHIRLVRDAQCVVVAPATADFMARAAAGRSDDLLCAMLLAARCPVMLVPAMNDRMWAHPQTVRNVQHLREIGYQVMQPAVGPLAFDEGEGPGRMLEPETIAAAVERITRYDSPNGSRNDSLLGGRRVVVTAGATREPIDPVRFISNYSTGRMGIAIARAAHARGADVTLVAGALEVPPPDGVRLVRVNTAADMAHAVAEHMSGSDVLIMAAAPADFKPSDVAPGKIKKANAPKSVKLMPTDDILVSTIGARPASMLVVGFALETDDLIDNARAMLVAKKLDMIVANRAGVTGEGFGAETNRVTIVTAAGDEPLPLMSKQEVAEKILDRVEALIHER